MSTKEILGKTQTKKTVLAESHRAEGEECMNGGHLSDTHDQSKDMSRNTKPAWVLKMESEDHHLFMIGYDVVDFKSFGINI